MNTSLSLFPLANDFYTAPIGLPEANAYVDQHHRHSNPTVGHIISFACYDKSELVGVAICGRPVGRKLDDGKTLEVYRVCTLGRKNACSKLYAACQKYAVMNGYEKVITYTLQSEQGISCKAANFILTSKKAGGLCWNGRTKFSNQKSAEYKCRWEYYTNPKKQKQLLRLYLETCKTEKAPLS